MTVIDKYNSRAEEISSLVCVGLDSDFNRLPERIKEKEKPQFEFNKRLIDRTHPHAAAYKLNSAFYEARGEQGIKELKLTIDYLKEEHPQIFTILDAKRADIGNTNKGYVEFAFDWLGFDAITLHPYLGKEALLPYLERKDKCSIILCRTSNAGAGEFQDLELNSKPLWQTVAERVSADWNFNQNCMLVSGATYPQELKKIREIVGDMTLLIPGIGAQGGDIEAVAKAGKNSQNKGMIINSSRGIIFAEDPGEEARKLKEEINKYL